MLCGVLVSGGFDGPYFHHYADAAPLTGLSQEGQFFFFFLDGSRDDAFAAPKHPLVTNVVEHRAV